MPTKTNTAALHRVVAEQSVAPLREVTDQLATLVMQLHDEEHATPARFCDFAACRLADEVMNGHRAP